MPRWLLDRRGGEVEVTENVVAAAAGNYKGKEVLRLLLDQRSGEVQVTENVVAAAERGRGGNEVMAILLDGRAQVEFTDRMAGLVTLSSKFSHEVKALFEKRKQDQGQD